MRILTKSFLLIVAIAAPAAAADESWIGTRVVVIHDRVAVLAGNETLDVLDRGDILTVANVKDRFVLAGRGHMGWIDQSHLLPLDAALADFNQAVMRNPQDLGARVGRAAIWVEQRSWDLATAEASEVIRLAPGVPHAWLVRSAAERGAKHFDRAEADARECIRLAPNWPHGFIAAGDALADRRQIDAAVIAYDAALKRDSTNARIYLRRGQARQASNNPAELQKALEDLTEAIRQTENDPGCVHDAQLTRARAYVKLGQRDKAIAEYDELLAQNLKDVPALIGRGIVLSKLRNFQSALDDANYAVQCDPNNVLVYLGRAEIRVMQFNTRGALADVEKALQIDPKNATAYRLRGEALVRDHKWEPAWESFGQAIKLEPQNAELYLARAKGYAAKKDMVRSDADRQQALAFDPFVATEPVLVSRSLGPDGRPSTSRR